MNEKKQFEQGIDPELLAEIEDWEHQEHDERRNIFLQSSPLPQARTPTS